MIEPPPEKIIWCYKEWQSAYESMKGVELCDGLPDLDALREDRETPKLLILDDLMDSLKKNPKLSELFTRGAHHSNTSVIHICQNLFFEGLRTARINTHYLFLMKSPADKLQVMNLAKQMYPGKNKFFMESFVDATSRPYGYLLVDCTPQTEDNLRLRTNVFPDETAIVYIPK